MLQLHPAGLFWPRSWKLCRITWPKAWQVYGPLDTSARSGEALLFAVYQTCNLYCSFSNLEQCGRSNWLQWSPKRKPRSGKWNVRFGLKLSRYMMSREWKPGTFSREGIFMDMFPPNGNTTTKIIYNISFSFILHRNPFKGFEWSLDGIRLYEKLTKSAQFFFNWADVLLRRFFLWEIYDSF